MKLVRFLLVLFGVAALLARPANAGGILEDGLKVDPFGLARSSQTLSDSFQRTLIQLAQLESKIDFDAYERLEQIRSILQGVVVGVKSTIDEATQKMLELEKQVNADALKLVYRAECTADKILNDQMQRAFAQFISNFRKAHPGVSILGIRVVSATTDEIEIVDANTSYMTMKAAVMKALNDEIKDDSKAARILYAYQNLEKAARFARCIYIDQPASNVSFTWEINEWERLSLPWVSIIMPQM